MQYAQHREFLLCCETAQQAHDVVCCLRIEARDGFVGKQYLRALCQRAGDSYTLGLAA